VTTFHTFYDVEYNAGRFKGHHFAAGFYCLIGDMTFAAWENCTSAQGVEAGICATGVEAYVGNGAGRDGPGSLLGLVGLVMVLKAMIW
jgi:hypothetical protein